MYKILYRYSMERPMGISEARARLPELARRIVAAPGRVEYITHRDLEEDIVMTTRSHLRFLEDSLAEMRRRSASSFRLAESMSSDLPDEAIEATLARVKSQARESAERKRAGLSG